MEQELRILQSKYDSNYARFEDSISKMGKLETDLKEQEETLLKRHAEINKLLKENRFYKDEVDGIRQRFGSLEEINKKFDIAKMKESKVSDLVAELDHTMKSFENQLSCYKCMEVLSDPVLLVPCTHVICRGCAGDKQDNKCPQCSKTVKDRHGPSHLIKDIVDKFEVTRDAIQTFKN